MIYHFVFRNLFQVFQSCIIGTFRVYNRSNVVVDQCKDPFLQIRPVQLPVILIADEIVKALVQHDPGISAFGCLTKSKTLFYMQICENIQRASYILPFFDEIRHHAKGSPKRISQHIKGRCRAASHNRIITKSTELFVIFPDHSIHFLGFLRGCQKTLVDGNSLR